MDAALIILYLLIIAGIDAAAVAVWLYVLQRADTNAADKGGRRHLRLFFRLGLITIPLSTLLYTTYGSIELLFYRSSYMIFSFIEEFLIVGPVEEFAKFLVFYWFAVKKDSIREPQDGILQAASVAVAFAAVENFQYGFYFGIDILLIRSLFSFMGHMAYASIWGFAAGIYLYSVKKGDLHADFSPVVYTLIIAAALHGTFNFSLNFALWISYCVDFTAIGLAVMALKYLKKRSPYASAPPLSDWRAGIVRLQEELTVNPDSVYFNTRIAKHYLYAGKLEEARSHLQHAKKRKPKSPELHLLLNVIRYLEGGKEPAAANFRTIERKIGRRSFLRLVQEVKPLITQQAKGDELLRVLNSTPYGRVGVTGGSSSSALPSQ